MRLPLYGDKRFMADRDSIEMQDAMMRLGRMRRQIRGETSNEYIYSLNESKPENN
jgi:hypothetical protein